MDKKELSFEESCDKLQDIINKIESGEQTLTQSLSSFEEGEKLIKSCYKELSKAKGKLTEIKQSIDSLEEI